MNYEQKYKEALERARHYYKANLKFLADIFPELQEPGDTSRQATEGLAGSSSDAHHYMKQKIKVEERHIADLWKLPCVNGLAKTHDGGMLVAIGSQATEQLAYEGDWLIENDDHTWSVERE